jgi:DNA-directed RNA polymerase specialized sigma24 family protein
MNKSDVKLEYVPYTRTEALTPKFLARLRARYQAGASVRDLSREMNISYGTTHTLLTRAGVEFRQRGGDQSGMEDS